MTVRTSCHSSSCRKGQPNYHWSCSYPEGEVTGKVREIKIIWSIILQLARDLSLPTVNIHTAHMLTHTPIAKSSQTLNLFPPTLLPSEGLGQPFLFLNENLVSKTPKSQGSRLLSHLRKNSSRDIICAVPLPPLFIMPVSWCGLHQAI